MRASDEPLTALLNAAESGDEEARNRVWNLIYGELRQLARHQVGLEGNPAAVQPTSLVDEAYLRAHSSEVSAWRCQAPGSSGATSSLPASLFLK